MYADRLTENIYGKTPSLTENIYGKIIVYGKEKMKEYDIENLLRLSGGKVLISQC